MIHWSILLALNTITNGELSDPLCDSVNRGLTLVRLLFYQIYVKRAKWNVNKTIIQLDHQQSAVRLMAKHHGVSRIYNVMAKVASCCKNFHFNFLCNPDRFSQSHKRTTSAPATESCTPLFSYRIKNGTMLERASFFICPSLLLWHSVVRLSVCLSGPCRLNRLPHDLTS